MGPQGYAIHRSLLVQLTSSLKGAARDDHRQNLIFSPLTNRGENPASKTINLPTKITLGLEKEFGEKLVLEVYGNYQFITAYIPQLIIKPNI